jgi:hypothetical protein
MDALGDQHLMPPLADIVKDYLAPKEFCASHTTLNGEALADIVKDYLAPKEFFTSHATLNGEGYRFVAGKGRISVFDLQGRERQFDKVEIELSPFLLPYDHPNNTLLVRYAHLYTSHVMAFGRPLVRSHFPELGVFVEFCHLAGIEPIVHPYY